MNNHFCLGIASGIIKKIDTLYQSILKLFFVLIVSVLEKVTVSLYSDNNTICSFWIHGTLMECILKTFHHSYDIVTDSITNSLIRNYIT